MKGQNRQKRNIFGRASDKTDTIKLVCLPSRQSHSDGTVFFGALCRALLAEMFVSGMALLALDAFEIIPENIGFSKIFFPALFFALAITLICRGGIPSAVGAVALFGGVFVRLFIQHNNLTWAFLRSAAAVNNAIVDKMMRSDAMFVRRFYMSPPGGNEFSESEYAAGVFLFVLLLSVLIVPAIVRRIRAVYLTLVTAAFTVPVFIYNLMRSNWGFALIVSAVFGVLVLFWHDRGYIVPSKKKRLIGEGIMSLPDASAEAHAVCRKKVINKEDKGGELTLESPSARRRRKRREKRKARILRREERRKARAERRSQRPRGMAAFENEALGGIAGLLAAVLIFMAASLPAHFVSGRENDIPYISDFMDDVRYYVTEFISGNDVDLNNVPTFDPSGYGDSDHSTEFDYPEYTGEIVATVEAPSSTPIYLRMWIGTRYGDNRWYSATFDETSAFHEMFGEDFSPEQITEHYYDVVYPGYASYSALSGHSNLMQYGFVTELINVTRQSGSGSLMYMPSYFRSVRGLMRYRSDERSRLPYQPYFDGIWTTKYFTVGSGFRVEAIVPTMRYALLGRQMQNAVSYYEMSLRDIMSPETSAMLGADNDTIEAYISEHEAALEAAGITYMGTSLLRRYLTEMTVSERTALIRNYELEDSYADYVKSTYLQTDESDNAAIAALAREILVDASMTGALAADASYEVRHLAILEMIKYLTMNYTYTIGEDDESSDSTDETVETGNDDVVTDTETEEQPEISAVEDFLFITKKGYCVQFASSLVLMLRSIGIPARYCEGYVAASFVNTDNIHSMNNDPLTRYRCDVTDNNAHSWVEVYYDDLGWVPYEATPVYYDGMYGAYMPDIHDPTPPNVVTPSPVEPTEPDEPDDNDGEDEDLDALERARRLRILIVTISYSAAVVSVVSICAIYLSVRSKRVLRERAAFIEKCRFAELSDDELHECAARLDRAVFAVYSVLGLSPEAGELACEYAARLDPVIGGASQQKMETIIEHIVREEFGRDLSREWLARIAEYYEELTRNVYIGLSAKNKFLLRYIKRVV